MVITLKDSERELFQQAGLAPEDIASIESDADPRIASATAENAMGYRTIGIPAQRITDIAILARREEVVREVPKHDEALRDNPIGWTNILEIAVYAENVGNVRSTLEKLPELRAQGLMGHEIAKKAKEGSSPTTTADEQHDAAAIQRTRPR